MANNSELCTEFQPSLLRGLRTPYSILTSWEEMYRIITQDKWVAEQTQLYRATHDDKYKHALPAVTTAVQLDGKGKATENIVGYTGVTHCDFDHVPAERLDSVIEKAKADPHTLLCNVSPSGNGVHIYARYSLSPKLNQNETENIDSDREVLFDENIDSDKIRLIFGEENYFEAFMSANCYYADLLNLPFDEQCSNPNKTLSLSHDPEAYYNPNAEVFVVAHTDSTDLTDCFDGEHLSTLISNDITNDTKEHIENPLNLLNPYATKTHWVKEYTDPIEFAEKYVREKQGLTYSEGYRNAYLYNCLNMMNLLGVQRTDAERWTQSFDLPEREKQSILKSAYKRTNDFGKFDRPYIWKEEEVCLQTCMLAGKPHAHTRAKKGNAPDIHDNSSVENDESLTPSFEPHSFPDYDWPQFISQMLACADSKPQKDVMLLGIFAVLGAMLGRRIKVRYSHRYWYPSLQVFVVAPPASGKSCISWVRHLAEPLHDARLKEYDRKKAEYDAKKAEYDNLGREKKDKVCPMPPALNMFLIAGNNSSTGILENLADADGHALICESEADTLSAAINADYGNWDDTLRKAHDHDRLSYNRRTNKEYRQIKNPCLGVLICGTPAQVKPLIPSAENGLFSRQLFATLPSVSEFVDQFDDGGDSLDFDSQFYKWGEEWMAAFDSMTQITSIELRLSDEQKVRFNSKFAERFHRSGNTAATFHMKSSVLREAINVLRMMMVVAFCRAIEFTDSDFDPFADDAEARNVEPKFRIDNSLLRIDSSVKEENIKVGAASRYELLIRDDDFNAVLAMAKPLYLTACDILSLLPCTEAVRREPSPMDLLLGSLPNEFTYAQAHDMAKSLDVPKGTLDSKLHRLKQKGHLVSCDEGRYKFKDTVTKRQ